MISQHTYERDRVSVVFCLMRNVQGVLLVIKEMFPFIFYMLKVMYFIYYSHKIACYYRSLQAVIIVLNCFLLSLELIREKSSLMSTWKTKLPLRFLKIYTSWEYSNVLQEKGHPPLRNCTRWTFLAWDQFWRQNFARFFTIILSGIGPNLKRKGTAIRLRLDVQMS